MSEEATVNPDGSTTFGSDGSGAGEDAAGDAGDAGGSEGFDSGDAGGGEGFDVPPGAEEVLAAKGIDPAFYLIAAVVAVVALYYYFVIRRKDDALEDDFFSNLDGEKVRKTVRKKETRTEMRNGNYPCCLAGGGTTSVQSGNSRLIAEGRRPRCRPAGRRAGDWLRKTRH
jgi:hypothetical protein